MLLHHLCPPLGQGYLVENHRQVRNLAARGQIERGGSGKYPDSEFECLQAQRRGRRAQLHAQAEEIRARNDELAHAGARLRAQAELLSEADERKTEFLGVLAHELRNPLAAISNSLFALSHASAHQGMRERAEQVIGRQTRLLSRLIEDLLDVTRINSGKIRIDRGSNGGTVPSSVTIRPLMMPPGPVTSVRFSTSSPLTVTSRRAISPCVSPRRNPEGRAMSV